MDEYAYELHIPGSPSSWIYDGVTRMVTAYDETEAQTKASNFANQNYRNWRIRNVRLVKKYINPDGEI